MLFLNPVLIASASSILLVSLAIILVSYNVPSPFGYFFAVPQINQTSCFPNLLYVINDNVQLGKLPNTSADELEDEMHGHLYYRKGPWRSKIGRWLSIHDYNAAKIVVAETIVDRGCRNYCSRNGVCNLALGDCRCFSGYEGDDCSERIHYPCNLPSEPGKPYGDWVNSMCSAHCDTTTAHCVCGPGTAYPDRPVSELCGFETINVNPPGYGNGGFTYADPENDDRENILTTNASKPGWCNVNPADISKVNYKKCDCVYDGQRGELCEIHVTSFCVNQCSLHGFCRRGACECDTGWYGIDCSIPSVAIPVKDWPKWLQPSAPADGPDEVGATAKGNDTKEDVSKVAITKRRPLIYIYDLPPEFNSWMLEGRLENDSCVSRLYDANNKTVWLPQLYAAQIALYESLLASLHRTLNAEEADYFYVPVLDSCSFTNAYKTPNFVSSQKYKGPGNRAVLTLETYKNAYDHIMNKYPFWNRSAGRDHIWFFSWDEGACFAPKEIWNSMMLVHWGNLMSPHNYSTTSYMDDSWNVIPTSLRGNHPCFDPDKDLVLPAWKRPHVFDLNSTRWARRRKDRDIFFYFNGCLGSEYSPGRPESSYSMGIRQKVAKEFASIPNNHGELGKKHTDDVIVTAKPTDNYLDELSRSIFCGVFPGDGWSGRTEDSILQGCIPVIIQDGILMPYESVLDYGKFSVRIQEEDIPNMIKIVRDINETQIDQMLENVLSIRSRYIYHDSIMLEDERQMRLYGGTKQYGDLSKLGGEDVFSTFIQVIHYKLYNDPWRRHLHHCKREFSFQSNCSGRGD